MKQHTGLVVCMLGCMVAAGKFLRKQPAGITLVAGAAAHSPRQRVFEAKPAMAGPGRRFIEFKSDLYYSILMI